MECHKCRYRADVTAGRYAHLEFAETPCTKCELKDGDSFAIEFNEELGGHGPEAMAEAVHLAAEIDPEDEQRVPVSVLWELVVTLLTLPPRTRDVVCWRYAGYKYQDIARVQQVTKAAAELRHRKALDRYPLLRCLFPAKVGRRVARLDRAAGREVGR